MSEVIFTTIHGSRLYGFAHADSDEDVYTVTSAASGRVKHVINGKADTVTVGIGRFLDLAMSGSHQSVEALFSPVKEWADTDSARMWRPIIEGVRLGGGELFEKYERTIRKFCYGDFKRRRHAARLKLSLDQLRTTGTVYEVRLHPLMRSWCEMVADQYEGDVLAGILGVAR